MNWLMKSPWNKMSFEKYTQKQTQKIYNQKSQQNQILDSHQYYHLSSKEQIKKRYYLQKE